MESPPTATRAVSRALDLLGWVATSDGLTLADAARLSNLPTSTALRLIRTLEAGEFISRSEDGICVAGPRVLAIGTAALTGLPLYSLAKAHVEALAAETGESCYLAVPGPDDTALYALQVESGWAVRHSSWVGRTVPLRGTAVGAALRDETDLDGCAALRETLEPDVTAVSGSIFGASGAVVGALSVVGPTYRISDEDLGGYRALISKHARLLSGQLGWEGRS